MIRYCSITCAVFMLFASTVFAQRAEPIDVRLAGVWEGARIEAAACDTYIWRVYRSADGKYRVGFFADTDMQDPLTQEEGTWWTNDGVFYEQTTAQENARNAYRYTIKAGKEVYFEYIARENEKNASDCEAEYSFTEFRKDE